MATRKPSERTAEQYRTDAAAARSKHNQNAANALEERAKEIEACEVCDDPRACLSQQAPCYLSGEFLPSAEKSA